MGARLPDVGGIHIIKLLIGGSPCTRWSIARSEGREVIPSGIGWELFLNYLIAKEKFQPDFFLYENNNSIAPAIKAQISSELGADLMMIDAALVSAQSRERVYGFNWTVEQPADRGIYLSDILVDEPDGDGYSIKDLSENEMVYMLRTVGSSRQRVRNHFDFAYTSQSWKPKSSCVLANWSKGVPYNTLIERVPDRDRRVLRIGTIENKAKNQAKHDSKQYRIYSPLHKAVTLCGEGGGVGAKTGLYLCPTNRIEGRKTYDVRDHTIEVGGVPYFINLEDGTYMVRKLTPLEAERLQTLPDGYTKAVSTTQRLRGLGNGWCAEVITHILNGALKDVPRDEKLVVLSMYDGIGTGRYCLDKMGFTNVEYHAYEIDPYAIKVAMSNYPDIIQHGDAFQLREPNWALP